MRSKITPSGVQRGCSNGCSERLTGGGREGGEEET